MKKLTLLSVFLFVFGVLGIAAATQIPFQVGTNGYLNENVTSGIGLIATQQALGTGTFYLEEGQTSGVINFFKVWVPLAIAEGTLDAYVELTSPIPGGDVTNNGLFKIKSFLLASKGSLIWDDPEPVSYSYNGIGGGLLTLDLFDISTGWQRGACYTISGTITNNQSPVPEPATMLLLGFGLIGIAGFGRKNFKG